MNSAVQTVAQTLKEMRDGERYAVRWTAEIIRRHEKIAFAQITDISRSGVAFRSDSILNFSEQYELVINGLGEFPCTILRRSGGANFAARFDINYDGKRRLDARIMEKLAEEKNKAPLISVTSSPVKALRSF